ncbi:tripartite tricarboxylate transporter substrate binding protein [Aquabacter sp. L1I39]|uniref:tripartite tricarboxylate transporter substrate binding protein n=1 Tax=Aquabacter sp. L1I39 TaxID=2820278 RepID=UPI001ADC8674|nr:tripartite tricarboxylate transporter substrate binding protein [Aquabacter sp. L1I39]QTL04148.1 tripartite tricarboxylate transporter substrate binding protein [Aquabacter sp. L1I39]
MDISLSRRRFMGTAAGLAAGLVAAPAVLRADTFPSRPVELVVGFAPGGGTDVTARTFAGFLSTELGGQVIVVNKPGASGEIALAGVARAKPDGYTLGVTNMPGLVTLPIERQTKFQLSDFDYVANLVSDPSAFSVQPDSPIKTLKDLVEAAKKDPGGVTFGSTGIGTDDHLCLVLFEQATGVKLNHVPFQGAGPMRTAVLGGQVTVAGLNVGEVAPFQTQLRMIAQGGATRSRFAPDVPTFKEQGVNVEMGSERGIVAPKGLPADVMAKLTETTARIMKNPDFLAKIESQYTQEDYLPGPQWRERLAVADAKFRALWQAQPWSGKA